MNITDILKQNEEEFEKKQSLGVEGSFLDYGDDDCPPEINWENIKKEFNDSQLRLISAFKEMVEETYQCFQRIKDADNYRAKIVSAEGKVHDPVITSWAITGQSKLDDLLSSLTEDKL